MGRTLAGSQVRMRPSVFYGVGLGIDFDFREGVVEDHVALADFGAVFPIESLLARQPKRSLWVPMRLSTTTWPDIW